MGWVGFDSVWSVHVMPRTSIFTRRSSSYQTGCFWQSMQVEHWPVLKKQSICSAMTCCAKTRNGQSRWVLQENFRSKGRGMVKKNRSLHCAILFFFYNPVSPPEFIWVNKTWLSFARNTLRKRLTLIVWGWKMLLLLGTLFSAQSRWSSWVSLQFFTQLELAVACKLFLQVHVFSCTLCNV